MQGLSKRQALFLLSEMVKRDFRARYAGSFLGLLWSLLQPLWMLLLFTFVFAVVMRFPLIGERTDNFAIFLFCGMLPWMAIQEGLTRSSTAITDNAELVKKVRFPGQVLVWAVVLAALLHSAIAALVFVVVLAWGGDLAWASLPLLTLILPLQVGLTIGLGLFLATLQVFVRDTAQVIGLLFTGWFYMTPIVYPLKQVPEGIRPWLALNPLTGLVGLYRAAFLGGGELWPPGSTALIVTVCAALILGYWGFRRLEPAFADQL